MPHVDTHKKDKNAVDLLGSSLENAWMLARQEIIDNYSSELLQSYHDPYLCESCCLNGKDCPLLH